MKIKQDKNHWLKIISITILGGMTLDLFYFLYGIKGAEIYSIYSSYYVWSFLIFVTVIFAGSSILGSFDGFIGKVLLSLIPTCIIAACLIPLFLFNVVNIGFSYYAVTMTLHTNGVATHLEKQKVYKYNSKKLLVLRAFRKLNDLNEVAGLKGYFSPERALAEGFIPDNESLSDFEIPIGLGEKILLIILLCPKALFDALLGSLFFLPSLILSQLYMRYVDNIYIYQVQWVSEDSTGPSI